jgi:TFIIF-interacting CTD phosphatase-like protein
MNLFKKIFLSGRKYTNANNGTGLNNSIQTSSKIITKINNQFNVDDSSSPKNMLRTLIDDDLGYEDIFNKLVYKANCKKTQLPEQSIDKKGKISLFIPMDEVFLYSYMPDENLGMIDMPKFKDYDIKIELQEYKTFAFIYLRDYLEEFLTYIDDKFEPILYTTGEKLYVDKIMNEIDPNRLFIHRLYQEDCHLYKDDKQNTAEFINDINLFTNRSLKRKLLIDFSSLNFVFSPDNSK